MSCVNSSRTSLSIALACIAASLLLHVIGLTGASRGIRITPVVPSDKEVVLQTDLLTEVPTAITAPVAAALPPPKMQVRAAPATPVSTLGRSETIGFTPIPPSAAVEPLQPVEPSAAFTPLADESVPSEPQPLAPTALPAQAFTSTSPSPVTLARSAVLDYSVAYGLQDNPLPQGVSTVRWQFAEDKFEIESISQATGLTSLLMRGTLTETSVGSITAQGLAPTRYGERRASRGERAIHFQWERGILSFSNHPQEVPLPSGVQDRLALRYQLGLLLQATPSLQQPGSVLEVPVATPSGLDIWTIVVRKQELLHTEAGDFPVFYLVRDKRPDRPYDQTLELWIAPSISWLPVRVRMVDANGRTLDAVLIKSQVQ